MSEHTAATVTKLPKPMTTHHVSEIASFSATVFVSCPFEKVPPSARREMRLTAPVVCVPAKGAPDSYLECLILYEVVLGFLNLRSAKIIFKPIFWLRLKILVC